MALTTTMIMMMMMIKIIRTMIIRIRIIIKIIIITTTTTIMQCFYAAVFPLRKINDHKRDGMLAKKLFYYLGTSIFRLYMYGTYTFLLLYISDKDFADFLLTLEWWMYACRFHSKHGWVTATDKKEKKKLRTLLRKIKRKKRYVSLFSEASFIHL